MKYYIFVDDGGNIQYSSEVSSGNGYESGVMLSTGLIPIEIEKQTDITNIRYDFDTGVLVSTSDKPNAFYKYSRLEGKWVDPRPLEEVKATQWLRIKRARTVAEESGFLWDGSLFDSNLASQLRISGAIQLTQLNPALTLDWTLADNTVRTLSAADLTAVGIALGAHVSTQFTKGQSLRAQIDAATTKEAVEAIVW